MNESTSSAIILQQAVDTLRSVKIYVEKSKKSYCQIVKYSLLGIYDVEEAVLQSIYVVFYAVYEAYI